jgi:hypothetical protein
MAIYKTLCITEYDDSGWNPNERYVANPEWSDVSAAIVNLNRFQRPYISLFLRNVSLVEEDSQPDVSVIGGRGAYALSVLKDGVFYFYVDENHGDQLIRIWESDQGLEVRRREVCFDTELAMSIVQHLFERGTWPAGTNWRTL